MRKRTYTETEDSFIRDTYLVMTRKKIAQCLGITENQVRHRLQRHILDNFHKSTTPWSEEEKQLLASNQNKPYNDLLDLIPNKRRRDIQTQLQSIHSVRPHGNRKHIPTPNYFQKWSPNMAYILGLIAADGHIYDGPRNPGKVAISLHSKDIALLVDIATEIELQSGAVHRRQDSEMSELVFYDRATYADLVLLGIMPCKSLRLPWINTPQKYLHHFVRGYFDGDGSLSYSGQKLTVQFLGTEQFLSGLTIAIDEILQVGVKNITSTRTKAKCLRYYRRQAMKVLDWLYHDEGLRLERKFFKYRMGAGSTTIETNAVQSIRE